MKDDDIDYEAAEEVLHGKIKNMTICKEWSDDAIACAAVDIELHDGTILPEVALWYIGKDAISTINYLDSPKAQKDFREDVIPQIVEMMVSRSLDHVAELAHGDKEIANNTNMESERIILELAGINFDELEPDD